tara:strand:+ start:4316 stop:4660 length:345 start_codon:yes stop_codon:yes gene_type:complete
MAITKVTSNVLSDDSVSYDKLGVEFTASSALSGTAIDWDVAQVFTKTLSGPTTFTYTNDEIGMVKDLVINGEYAITWPSGTKIITGTYDGSVPNLIQVVKTAAGQYWLSISKEA